MSGSKALAAVIAILVLVVAIALVPYIRHVQTIDMPREGFEQGYITPTCSWWQRYNTPWACQPQRITNTKYDFYSDKQYANNGRTTYNKLGETVDMLRVSKSDSEINSINQKISDAVQSADIQPDTSKETLMGPTYDKVKMKMPLRTALYEQAQACEAVKGRDACYKLGSDNPPNMGVCVLGGTPVTVNGMSGKHIGGMLLIPDDRTVAELNAKETGTPVTYEPTMGSCPAGNFFVEKEACIKASNRLDCKESGESGGFSGGKTIEGKSVVNDKCANAPTGGNNVFIYEPRGRAFSCNLRVLTPTNTGQCKVWVYSKANSQFLGFGESSTPGVPFIVRVNGVTETMQVRVMIQMEAPHSPKGKREAFIYTPLSGVNQISHQDATKICKSIGATQATYAQAYESFTKGAQAWACSLYQGGSGLPAQAASRYNIQRGINNYCNGAGHFPWCYGVRPAKSSGGTNSDFGNPNPFFTPLPWLIPAQQYATAQWSQHGSDYQAPGYRAVVLQWEHVDDARRMVVPFEPSIVAVNGMGPSMTAPDGTMTFKSLRRFGTYRKSSLITAPKYRTNDDMLGNQFWIWTGQPNNKDATFDAQVPGVFLPPHYEEDASLIPRGQLITSPDTMRLLRTSPCLKDNQNAGAYTMECLQNLFVGNGGDMLKGKLTTAGIDGSGAGLMDLNGLKAPNGGQADLDTISTWLAAKYILATTGRDMEGKKVGKTPAEHTKLVNAASQLLFGFDISNPCEEISEDSAGNIVVTPMSGSFTGDCLDYLWLNADGDKSRGEEDAGKRSKIKNTYVRIEDRFSGLKKDEGTPSKRSETPFAACSRKGLLAPVKPNGSVNQANINKANTYGNIQAIQNWYNNLHYTANYLGGRRDSTSLRVQQEAMEGCYGVMKATGDGTEEECGILARYIRILVSGIYGSNNPSPIQIPQIQVFDKDGNELARGKRATSSSQWYPGHGATPDVAVNGNTTYHYHPYQFHSHGATNHNEYWMVDLGRTYGIHKIRFYYRVGCCPERQLAAPVQFLNEGRQIAAQKYLGEVNYPYKFGEPEDIPCSIDDVKPQVTIEDALKEPTRITLLSATSWDRVATGSYSYDLRGPNWNWNWWASTSESTYPSDVKVNATLIIVPGLNGRSGDVSFRSSNDRNAYMRHAGFRLWRHSFDGSDLFRQDASFKILPALSGDPNMVSFQSVNYPDYYIGVDRNDRVSMWATTVNANDIYDVQRVCWRMNVGFD